MNRSHHGRFHNTRSHYPGFDVLAQQEHWDAHTRSVVTQRTRPPDPPARLQEHEVQTLKAVIGHLLYEHREDLLDFVVAHFAQRLSSRVGEGQREQGTPPEAQLVRTGLASLDAVASHRHGRPFRECTIQEQFQILASLQKGQLEGVGSMASIPQKPLFKKLLGLAVEAYASHPTVWSEMGYAGPAYPRGYYRLEQGLTDPWEARRPRNGAAPEQHPAGRPDGLPEAETSSGPPLSRDPSVNGGQP